jgi:hypothetical protein
MTAVQLTPSRITDTSPREERRRDRLGNRRLYIRTDSVQLRSSGDRAGALTRPAVLAGCVAAESRAPALATGGVPAGANSWPSQATRCLAGRQSRSPAGRCATGRTSAATTRRASTACSASGSTRCRAGSAANSVSNRLRSTFPCDDPSEKQQAQVLVSQLFFSRPRAYPQRRSDMRPRRKGDDTNGYWSKPHP